MATKAPSWCARCKCIHVGSCPNLPVWKKPVHKSSGRGGRPWRRKRERIFERDNYLCQIHLRRGELVTVELGGINAGVCDHVIAIAQGGSDGDENLQTICKFCDKAKTAAESKWGRGV